MTLLRRRGFTLLEVLVAIAILGLGLTVILSSQVGLFAGISHSRNLSFATNLARCRMSEVEVDLAKEGYPIIDQYESGPCCEDEKDPTFGCSWKIEMVELPEPPLAGEEDLLGLFGADAGSGGPFGAMQSLQENGAEALTGDGGISGLAGLFGESTGSAGMDGLTSMVMQAVYPALKPMLEASIRKLTVTVAWKEGRQERELTVVQYVTNPMQGGLDLEAGELDVPGGNPFAPGTGTGQRKDE